MTDQLREFYASSNGDRWFIGRGDASKAFVRHKANGPSGGAVTHIEVGVFLGGNADAPECSALLRLIGTLVHDQPISNVTAMEQHRHDPDLDQDDTLSAATARA